METKLYRALQQWVMQVPHPPRRCRQQFTDHLIVLVLFWAVLHDRPIHWACEETNWPKERDHELPSGSTLSRRLRTVGVLQLLERILVLLCDQFPDTLVKAIDSKPLRVGCYSQDRDARRGRAGKDMAKGYKLHALAHNGIVKRWTLASMNVNDQVPAQTLLGLVPAGSGGYVAADNGYDSNLLHRLSSQHNHQLVAPPRKSNRNVRDLRRNHPARLRSLDLCDWPLRHCGLRGGFGRAVMRHRVSIERTFSVLCFDGLNAPPPWVRTPHRLAQWTAAKLILRLFRTAQKQGLV